MCSRATGQKGNGLPGDSVLDKEQPFLWHDSVNTKRLKKIAQQALLAIFLAILFLSLLVHRLYHPP